MHNKKNCRINAAAKISLFYYQVIDFHNITCAHCKHNVAFLYVLLKKIGYVIEIINIIYAYPAFLYILCKIFGLCNAVRLFTRGIDVS